MEIIGVLFILFVVLLIHLAGVKMMKDYCQTQDIKDSTDDDTDLDLSNKR